MQDLLDRNDDRAQDDQVPESVLKRMYDEFVEQRQLIIEEARVLNFRIPEYKSQPKTVIFDVDGTIASYVGIRSPYDFEKVSLDQPRHNIIDLANQYVEKYNVAFFSGRDRSCYGDTVEWIGKWVFSDWWSITLRMRPKGDKRPDWIVKGEMMIAAINNDNNFYPWMVFDDRQQVVNIWDNMGIEVIQVQQGRF